MIEQRFTAFKSMMSFQRRLKGVDDKSRFISRFVKINYAAGAIIFAVISSFIVFWNSLFLFAGGGMSTSNMIFILFVYALIINLYNTLYLMGSVRREHLIDPLIFSAIARPESVLMKCYMKYYGSLSIFISVPGCVILAIELRNPLIILAAVMWTLIIIFMSWPLGVIFSAKVGGGSRHSGTLEPIIRILSFAFSLAGLEIILYSPQLVPNMLPSIQFPLSILIFPFNIPYIFDAMSSPGIIAVYGLIVTAIYMVVFYEVSVRTNGYVGRLIREGFMQSSGKHGGRSAGVEPLKQALERKDRKILIRDSQVSTLIAIPIIVAVPTLFPVFMPSGGISGDSIGIYYLMLSITAICASFYPSILLMSESGSIALWRQFPLDARVMLKAKERLALKMFAIIAIPLTLAALIISGSAWEYYVTLSVGLISGFVYLMVRNVDHLFSRIPAEASRVNLETFGGNLGLLLLSATSILFLVIPFIFGSLIADLLPFVGSMHLMVNSFLDSSINVLLMIFAIRHYGI